MPEDAVRYKDDIYVSLFTVNQLPETIYLVSMLQAQRYKCVSLNYQSRGNWTEMKDILRCNPNFHSGSRFDCVIIHDDAPGITCARLQSLIRCWLPAGKVLDLALVHKFTCSKWKPRTSWKGCRILDEDEGSLTIVSLDYLLRGALMCPVSEREGEKAVSTLLCRYSRSRYVSSGKLLDILQHVQKFKLCDTAEYYPKGRS